MDFYGGKYAHFRVGTRTVSVTITLRAEVNLAWWLAWTSNPVVVHRKVGWVGSIPMHLRQFVSIWGRTTAIPL